MRPNAGRSGGVLLAEGIVIDVLIDARVLKTCELLLAGGKAARAHVDLVNEPLEAMEPLSRALLWKNNSSLDPPVG